MTPDMTPRVEKLKQWLTWPIEYTRVWLTEHQLVGSLFIAAVLWIIGIGFGVEIFLSAKRHFDDSDIKALGAIIVSVSAGSWVLMYSIFTGALFRERENYVPRIELDWGVVGLTPYLADDTTLRVPLSICVNAKNSGNRTVKRFDYANTPLMLFATFDAAEANAIKVVRPISLPYLKIHAPSDNAEFLVRPYKQGYLPPGDTEHFSFLHPGAVPGIYLIQFQLTAPADLRKIVKEAIWTRMAYIEVTPSGKVTMPLSVLASKGDENKTANEPVARITGRSSSDQH